MVHSSGPMDSFCDDLIKAGCSTNTSVAVKFPERPGNMELGRPNYFKK
jgi:hypothetical protein